MNNRLGLHTRPPAAPFRRPAAERLKWIRRADDPAVMTWPVLLVLVATALCVLPNIRIVKEGECLVVYRLGRFHRVLAPGLNLVPWGVETTRRVDLGTVLPEWRSLSDEELSKTLEQLARTGRLPPVA